jgi:chemotaxis protein methyltransferase CheR
MLKSQLSELRKHLLLNLGLNFTASRENELYKKIGFAAKEFNFKNTDAFINWIVNNNIKPKQIEKLAAFLTIGETYFFREIKALDYLEHKYLTEIIYKRRGKDQRLRIWSAGCASGEEPYSIAIILKRVIPDIKNWNITILATDINAKFLEKARKGIYTKWSFRGLPGSFKKDHFKEIEKDKFQINPEIKKMITFSYQNLAKDTYPSLDNNTNAMDIIFCRNVLIYFSNNGINEVTSNLYNCLTNDGILLVSPVDSSNLISPKFSRFQHDGITIYQKGTKKTKKEEKKILNWEIPENIEFPTFKLSPKDKKQEIVKPAKRSKRHEVSPHEAKQIRMDGPVWETRLSAVAPIAIGAKEENLNPQKAYSLFKKGLFEEAETILSNILNYNKENLKTNILLLARIKANLGKLEDAEQLCKKAINIDKIDPIAHYLLATILGEHGKEEDAIQSLNKALFLDPDFTLAYFLLGNYSLKSGKIAQSGKYFNNALKTLSTFKPDEVLAESDGLTVGRLKEIINSIKK